MKSVVRMFGFTLLASLLTLPLFGTGVTVRFTGEGGEGGRYQRAASSRDRAEANAPLVGAWRGGVQFTTGAFAATKDLEFMYVFNAGGTMTESSNYDGSPPVPPAYGVWRRVGERKFEAKYAYYWTKPPPNFEEIIKGNGWAPGGHGVLLQEITLSADGNSFESTIRYQVFDQAGKPTEKESIATAKASRMGF